MRSPLMFFLWKRPCHTEIVLFFTFWLTCAYFFQPGGWNDSSRLNLTYCLVDYKTSIIEQYNNKPGFNTGDVSIINGRTYSNKSPATSFIAIPAYVAFKSFAKYLGLNQDDPLLRKWFMTNAVVSLAGGICAALLYRLLITFGLSIGLSAALSTFFSLGTMHLGFAVMYYPYTLVEMFLLLGLLMFRGIEYKGTAQGSGFLTWFLAGWFIGNAAFIEFPCGLLVICFSIYAFYLMGRGMSAGEAIKSSAYHKRFVGYAIGGIFSMVPYLIYVYLAFGKFINIYDYQALGFFDEGYKKGGLFGFQGFRPTVIYYLLIHPYRGMFFHSPVMLLAIPGWIIMLKRKKHLGMTLLTLSCSVVFIIFFAGNFAWWGGFGYAPRYLAPIVPFFFIPIAYLVKESSGPARRAMWVLGIVSVALHLMATAVDSNTPESINYEQAKDPKFTHNYPSPVLTWTYMAYKDGTINVMNIGKKVGLQRQYSLYPLYVFLALMFSLHFWKKDPVNYENPMERFTDKKE